MDRTDEEQLQQLKDWWKRNGPPLLIGAGVAIALAAGWWGYGNWQERSAQQAAGAYAEFLQAEHGGELEAAEERGQRVLDRHAASGYAVMTALRLARLQVENEAFERAAETLGWVVDHADDRPMRELARLRQARALAEIDPERALTRLDVDVSDGFRAAYAELRGDLLHELGRDDEAAEAYRAALDSEGLGGQARELVRLKLQAVETEA